MREDKADCIAQTKPPRDSNIELLRILMMLVIIAHHYVVNSGIAPLILRGVQLYSFNLAFALCFGFGGKMAINVFVLITGYFMCRKEFRWRKVVNLLCLMVFYRYVIYVAFLLTGYEAFNLKEFVKTVLFVPLEFGKGFSSSFLGLYVLVPFINKAIQNFEKKDLQRLILTLLFLFTVLSSFLLNTAFEYIGWYVTVYLIGAYLHLYPVELLEKRKNCLWLTLATLFLCYASVIVISFAALKMKRNLPVYWFVSDSNKILAVATAVAFFCLFKTFRIGHIKVINTLAASTFGILLIHASSDTMRNWLWNDVMQTAQAYTQRLFPLYAFAAVFTVYIVCFAIDFARKQILRGMEILWKRKESM